MLRIQCDSSQIDDAAGRVTGVGTADPVSSEETANAESESSTAGTTGRSTHSVELVDVALSAVVDAAGSGRTRTGESAPSATGTAIVDMTSSRMIARIVVRMTRSMVAGVNRSGSARQWAVTGSEDSSLLPTVTEAVTLPAADSDGIWQERRLVRILTEANHWWRSSEPCA